MSSNISISYPNRVNELVLSSPSSWSANLPLTNIQDRIIKKVARTTPLTAAGVKTAVINANLMVQSREIGCIALINHNLSINATVRFIGYSELNGGGNVRFDSTDRYRAWTIINPPETGVIPLESPNFWLGTVEEDQRQDYTHICSFYPPTNQMCRSFQIVITDPLNTYTTGQFVVGKHYTILTQGATSFTTIGAENNNIGTVFMATGVGGSGLGTAYEYGNDPYIEIGRLFLGRCLEPVNNPEYGDFSQGYVDLSEMKRAADNTKYFRKKPKMRTLDVALKHLDKAEAFSGFYDAQRLCGLTGEILYAFSKPEYIASDTQNINMTTDKNFYAQNFLANFAELNPITMPYVNGYATSLKLEEIV